MSSSRIQFRTEYSLDPEWSIEDLTDDQILSLLTRRHPDLAFVKEDIVSYGSTNDGHFFVSVDTSIEKVVQIDDVISVLDEDTDAAGGKLDDVSNSIKKGVALVFSSPGARTVVTFAAKKALVKAGAGSIAGPVGTAIGVGLTLYDLSRAGKNSQDAKQSQTN